MRQAVLIRIEHTDQGTWGVLAFGQHHCRSLELPWRDNRRQVSCIPPGIYRCGMVGSPRFGRVYQVHDVPGRSAILIHAANLAGDVQYALADFIGCFIDAGPAHSPDDRPYIERFFGTVASSLSSRLPGYTGTNARDIRRALADP